MPREIDVSVADRLIRVRVVGDDSGRPIVFFHGTPSSRLDLRSHERLAENKGVRLVSFDRPGCGASTPAAFDLLSVARDVEAIVESLGIDKFAVFGQSAGTRYALATAAVLADRVSCAGCASGDFPLEEAPGAVDDLDELDRAAYALLPGDPVPAAHAFAASYEPLVQAAHQDSDDAVVSFFESMLCPADLALLAEPAKRANAVANVRESLSQGAAGVGWDLVTWASAWPFDLHDVACPVHLWWGTQDEPLTAATWLRDHLPDATLVLWLDEGHLAYKRHLHEVFSALTLHD